jgi:hypothetical protein
MKYFLPHGFKTTSTALNLLPPANRRHPVPTHMTKPFRQRASALVTTLFVVVVLSTIIVAFLQSMSLERRIAQGIKGKYQAESSPRRGCRIFSRLQYIKTDGPYSAIYSLGPNMIPIFSWKEFFHPMARSPSAFPSSLLTGLTNF